MQINWKHKTIKTHAQITDLEHHVQELTQQLEAARAESQKSSSVEMASLLIAQEESQRIIEQLQT